MSHPARGAWIEIYLAGQRPTRPGGRTPQGVRGLKSGADGRGKGSDPSHPARGAWIEISMVEASGAFDAVAPRKGCVD